VVIGRRLVFKCTTYDKLSLRGLSRRLEDCLMRSTHFWRPLVLVAALTGCSTSSTGPSPSETTNAGAVAPESAVTTPAELCEAQLGAAEPVHSVGNIYLAGQPQQHELDELAERGIKTVVSLRKPEELDWDEKAAVEATGMQYVAIPFDGPEELTDEVFDRVRDVLGEKRDEPLVLHCGRANRVGAVWMVHRVLNDGVGIDQALEEAKTAGLRTPEYIDKAQDYIRRAQSAAPSEVEGNATP
jgi:uncharacterized protein (TIGR01244 family)